MTELRRYAVVLSQGCYGSGETVQAISVHASLADARRAATAATARYKRAMARHGGTSGGYRVVETSVADPSWLGRELDLRRTP